MTTTKSVRPYKGVFTDNRNWDRFEHRPGDVFICVPPKSGTTWMQNICGLLIFGDPDADVSYPEISPWIEFSLSSKTVDARLEMLATQTHRRFIKSHTPLDGIPYYEDCIYLACHRHPLDVHFSMWHHVQNMKIDHIDHLHTHDKAANFDAFLANSIENEGLDQPSLELITHHCETARARAKLPNVHLFHYATLSQDLAGQMRQIAKALDIAHPETLFDALVEKATFKSMKANALKTAPGAKGGLYKDPNAFFNSGQGRKWDGILGAEQMARYTQRIETLLAPNDVTYLETGRN